MTLPALLAYLDRRGRPGQRPRRRHPDRGRLGQAAHGPPRQGPRVGRRFPGRRVRDPVPVQPVAHRLDVRRRRCCPRRCGATPATSRSWPATTRPRSTPTAPTTAPTTRRRSSGSGYVAFTRAAHRPRRHVLPLEPARDAVRALGLPRVVRDQLEAWGEPVGDWLEKPRQGRRPTPTTPSTRPARGRCPARARRRPLRIEAAAAVVARRPTRDGSRRAPRHGRGRPGRRVGRRARPAAGGGPARRDRRRSTCRCPSSLSATSLARLRDDPDDVRPRAGPADAAPAVAARPASAPASTPGWRPGSASRTSSTPTSCPVVPTPASTPKPTSPS